MAMAARQANPEVSVRAGKFFVYLTFLSGAAGALVFRRPPRPQSPAAAAVRDIVFFCLLRLALLAVRKSMNIHYIFTWLTA
jgi:hypothetical protein